jgi:3-hydroxyisobutyrate dehydrogenase-like beta-hydroxyacid dehydrogenase
MAERVGLVGLGKMGLPMARLMLGRGHQVFVHDLQPAQIARAVECGANRCADAAELAAQTDLVIVVVGFDSEVVAAATGERGLFAGAREGATIAVASTVAPQTMRTLAGHAAAQGKRLRFLDIPLCRGERAVAQGELLILVGGEAELFERWKPVFACFASDLHHLGPLGAGQVGKMVNNLLLWACTAANYEGLKLGQTLGVEPKKLRDALVKSSANNFALETWFEPRPMPWAEKDMALVMDAARSLQLVMPVSAAVQEVMVTVKRERGLATPAPRT